MKAFIIISAISIVGNYIVGFIALGWRKKLKYQKQIDLTLNRWLKQRNDKILKLESENKLLKQKLKDATP
jgi:hypothetical protein